MMWPALVLTAGLGTRLRPLSDVRAKPAMPVAGQALIRRILSWLLRCGVRDAILNLHYRPETITAVVGDGSDLGLRVRYSFEHPILGSAGGPRRALALVDSDRFFVVNGDTLCDVALRALAAPHEASGARVTMALTTNPDPARYGGATVDPAEGIVTGFTRAGSGRPSWHFVGVQAVDTSVFAGLPENRPAESVGEVYPALIAREAGSVRPFRTTTAFYDVGTPRGYLETVLAVARTEGLPEIPPGDRVTIAPSAIVERTAIWDDVAIEAGCRISDAVIADGVVVPAHSEIHGCAVVRSEVQAVAGGMRAGSLLAAPLHGGAVFRIVQGENRA